MSSRPLYDFLAPKIFIIISFHVRLWHFFNFAFIKLNVDRYTHGPNGDHLLSACVLSFADFKVI